MDYNVLKYGAINNGKILNSKYFQSAIDQCYLNGGGRVVVPKGDYLLGTIYLKSGVELHLEKGAKLISSTNLDDYNDEDAYPQNSSSKIEMWRGKHLIIVLEQSNISVTGEGEIDGNGDYFYEEPRINSFEAGYMWRYGFASSKDKVDFRPGQLVCFIECKNIKVQGITVKNTTCWAWFFHGCENVQIDNLKVFNPIYFANTDGIDIDCCKNVNISDCEIDTGDDALAIRCNSKKLKNPKPCENISVKNCKFSASACAIRFGVGVGEIHGVKVENISVGRAGATFLIQTRYGQNCCADISDITVNNVTAKKVCWPIVVGGPVGSVKNIQFSNMTFDCIAGTKISAVENCSVSNITLKNIEIHLSAEPKDTVFTEVKLRERGHHVLQVENTNGVTLNNVKVFADSYSLEKWSGIFSEENNDNLKITDCKL